MAKRTAVARAQKKLREFAPRGSRCPICKQPFRGCPHSVLDARDVLKANVIRAVVREELSKTRCACGGTHR